MASGRHGQTSATHASSPRARDDNTTGTAPSGFSPHKPAKRPLTMPRSTAQSTGYCDAVHGGAKGALPVARGHVAGQGPPVVLAHPFGHVLGRFRPEQVQGLLEQQYEQVVTTSEQVECGVVADHGE